MANNEIILLNISGEDKPGLTASLTALLADYEVNILDMGQAVIHDDLALGILLEVPEKAEASPILKDLLFKAHELGLSLKFTPVKAEEYNDWVDEQGKGRYIISLLGRKLTALQIARVTEIISSQQLNIDFITRLTGRVPLAEVDNSTKACVEFSVRGTPRDIDEMRHSFIEVSHQVGVDIAFQKDTPFRRNRRLVCFDMDSTLIQTEVIVELADRAGVREQVHQITEAAMRGELDFNQSFTQRVALLKGLEETVLKDIAEKLPITEGAERLIRTLKRFGYKTAILSGGFSYFGRYLQHRLGVDYVFANELEIENGRLTGRHVGDIVNGEMKAELLKKLAFKEDIHLEQVIAVGDGANDLPMLKLAGLGIAFHAKPIVQKRAQHAISTMGLDGILYLLGFRDREMAISTL